jgi:hypothetical protein
VVKTNIEHLGAVAKNIEPLGAVAVITELRTCFANDILCTVCQAVR